MINYLGCKKKNIINESIYNNIIDCIYSIEVKDYLIEHREEITLLQWGTLALEFWKGKKDSIFRSLRDLSTSEYERQLFNIAIKDIIRFNDISDKTIEYYSKNDPRGENKPNLPFAEKIELPIIFKTGDIVKFESDENNYYLIGKEPIITSDGDISDYSYLCYIINKPITNEDDLFKAHSHLNVCSINKVPFAEIPKEIKEYIPYIVENVNNLK